VKTDDWLGFARQLAETPGFVEVASQSRTEAGRIVGPDPLLRIKAHDLAQHLAAGRSFAEYEQLERVDAAEMARVDRSMNWGIFVLIAGTVLAAWGYFAFIHEPQQPTCVEKYGVPVIYDPRTGEPPSWMTGCRFK
jgi:hypothetical protein